MAMIDRLELLVPLTAPRTAPFWNKHSSKRAKRGSPYQWTIDAGRDLALSVHGGHREPIPREKQHFKIDFTDTRLLTAFDLILRVQSVFSLSREEAMQIRVARIDFAADVHQVPVEWFRQNARVLRKRSLTGYEVQKTETSKGITSIIFGKRPDLYRIYDRPAEKRERGENDWLFHGWDSSGPLVVITRIERQCSSRSIPKSLRTLGAFFENAAGIDPFDRLVCSPNSEVLPSTDDWTPTRWLMNLGLACAVERLGEPAVRSKLNKSGNAHRFFSQYSDLLRSGPPGPSRELLVELYRKSTLKQLNIPTRTQDGELVFPRGGAEFIL